MSYRIPVNGLSDEQSIFIRKNLTLTPVDSSVMRYQHVAPETKAPVSFYYVDGEQLALPFTFGVKVFGPKVLDKPQVTFQFTKELLSHQLSVYEKCLAQVEEHKTTVVGVYPGFGKTVLGAKLAAQCARYTLVYFHRTLLGPQWKTTFKEFTNASIWLVGEEPMPSEMPQITLCMDTRITMLPDWYRQRIGTLIIDEAHAFCTPGHVHCLLALEPEYIIAETATLQRTDGMHNMIQAVCGMHGVFQASTQPFEVIKYETGITPPAEKRSFRGQMVNDFGKMKNWLWNCEERNDMIIEIIKANSHRKILVLTGSVEIHIPILMRKLREANIKCDWFASNKKSYQDSPVLVGTMQKIGTGFDEKTMCATYNNVRIDMVILTTSLKSLSQLEQNAGRAFRSQNPIIVDLVDNHRLLQSHWNERKKWYLSRNGIIKEFIMPGRILESNLLPKIPEGAVPKAQVTAKPKARSKASASTALSKPSASTALPKPLNTAVAKSITAPTPAIAVPKIPYQPGNDTKSKPPALGDLAKQFTQSKI